MRTNVTKFWANTHLLDHGIYQLFATGGIQEHSREFQETIEAKEDDDQHVKDKLHKLCIL